MTLSFTYEPLPGRVVFGAGSLDSLPAEAVRLGARKVLILPPRASGLWRKRWPRCLVMPPPVSMPRP